MENWRDGNVSAFDRNDGGKGNGIGRYSPTRLSASISVKPTLGDTSQLFLTLINLASTLALLICLIF